jgi:hypothetical protein
VPRDRIQIPRPKLFLVILEDGPRRRRPKRPGLFREAAAGMVGGKAGESATGSPTRTSALKQELRAKEEYLQTTNEELAPPTKSSNPPTRKCSR